MNLPIREAPETARLLAQLRARGIEPPWCIGEAFGISVYIDPAMAPGAFRVVKLGPSHRKVVVRAPALEEIA